MPTRLPAKLLIYSVTVFLVAALLYPLFNIVTSAMIGEKGFNFDAFNQLFNTRGIKDVFSSTVIYALGSACFATLFGSLLAWINVRTDGEVKSVSGLIPLLPIMIPPIGSALGYLILFSPQSGSGNRLLRYLFGLDEPGPININTMSGMVIVTGLSLAPVVYLVVSAALKNVDPALEEAARISGYGPWRTVKLVTMPLVLPAISSIGLLVAIHAISSFSFPFILGTGAGITPISVYIYRLFSSFPARTEIAIAASILLLVIVYAATWFQSRLVKNGNFARVGGKFSAPSVIRLGRWRIVARALVFSYVALSVLPLVGLVIGMLQPFLGASSDQWGLANIHTVLGNEQSRSAILNSLKLGIATATINMTVIGTLLYFSQSMMRRSNWIDYALMSPSVVPHIVVGVAFAVAYSTSPFNLQGTLTLVLLAYCVIFLPEAARSVKATLSQLNPELSEAGHVFGSGPLRTFFKIVLPQARGGIVAGWLVVFFVATNEVTASSFLGGFNSMVVGYVAIDYFANGRLGEVATIALIATLVTSSVVLVIRKLLLADQPHN